MPCIQTHASTVFINEKKLDDLYEERTDNETGVSRIDIAFSSTVDTYINDFEAFELPPFIAFIGGSFGLWLGLGVLQMMESTQGFVSMFCRKIKE